MRWGRDLERELMFQSSPKPRKEIPTLAKFAPRFLDGYARANRHKPSGIAAKDTIQRIHLIPLLAKKRLDKISSEDIQRLKSHLEDRAQKTVNNVLSVLSMTLKIAMEWGIIDQLPCVIRQLRTSVSESDFHDFPEFERLIRAAGGADWRADGQLPMTFPSIAIWTKQTPRETRCSITVLLLPGQCRSCTPGLTVASFKLLPDGQLPVAATLSSRSPTKRTTAY